MTPSSKSKTVALPQTQKVCSSSPSPAHLTMLSEADRRVAWSPLTAGPFLVPVTRWVE